MWEITHYKYELICICSIIDLRENFFTYVVDEAENNCSIICKVFHTKLFLNDHLDNIIYSKLASPYSEFKCMH